MKRLIFFFGLMSFASFGQHSFSTNDTIDVYQPSETEIGEAYFQIPVDFNDVSIVFY